MSRRYLSQQNDPLIRPSVLLQSSDRKKLDAWFKPGTVEDVFAYHKRTDDEWKMRRSEIEEQEKQHQARVKDHQTKLAAERKRRQRAKDVAEDILAGRRDESGKIIPKKVFKVSSTTNFAET